MKKTLFLTVLSVLFVFGNSYGETILVNDGSAAGIPEELLKDAEDADLGALDVGLPTDGLGKVLGSADKYVDADAGTISLELQHSVVKPGSDSAVAVVFKTKGDWHYYADKKQIPTGQLEVAAEGEGVVFGKPVYPQPKQYDDKVFNKTYGIYQGEFMVYIPFKAAEGTSGKVDIKVRVDGAVCAEACKFLDEVALTTTVNVDADAIMPAAAFEFPLEADGGVTERPDEADEGISGPMFSMPVAFSMAILAGLLLNVMPCVWPIIPIIITRLWNLSGKSQGKSMAFGVAFAVGILLFFAIIAGANIVLQVGYNHVFQWGDFNREPGFNIGLSMLMVVMGLFMFGVFQFTLPAAVSNKAGAGEGLSGAVGMGFLLALLSTPCGFGVLAAAFAWAQSQPLWLSTFTIMLIGVGMALPFVILTSIPGLLNRMPKPGGWMEHVKVLLGFLMLLIAVKILSAVPSDMRINALYFAVLLSLAVWIWGWVTMSTTRGHKYAIRLVAVAIAVFSGWLLLGGTGAKVIDWQEYDPMAVEKDIQEGKPVLIKFTADWCTTCTVVDKFVYSREDVGEFLKEKGVQAYLADTGIRGTVAAVDLKQKYKEPSIPVTVIHLADGKEERLRGMFSKKDLYAAFGIEIKDSYFIYYCIGAVVVLCGGGYLYFRKRKRVNEQST